MKRLFLYFQLSLIGSIVFLNDFAKADPCQSYASQAQRENTRVLSCVPVTIDVPETPSHAGKIGSNIVRPSNGGDAQFNFNGKRADGSEIDVKTRNIFLKEISDPIPEGKSVKTWLVTHGWNDNSEGGLKSVAEAIAQQHKGDRVIMLDWSEASVNAGEKQAFGLKDASLGNYYAATWIHPVAKQVVTELKKLGIDDFDASRNLNLVGHSLGSLMSSEIGGIYKESQKANPLIKDEDRVGVNSLIALDPASELNASLAILGGYDLDGTTPAYTRPTLGGNIETPISDILPDVKYRPEIFNVLRGEISNVDRPKDFNSVSRNSKAFVGKRSIAGNQEFAGTAHQSFELDFGGLRLTKPGDEHGRVVKVYEELIRNPSLLGGMLGLTSNIRENLDRTYLNAGQKHNGTLRVSKDNKVEGLLVTHSQRGELDVTPNGVVFQREASNPNFLESVGRFFFGVPAGEEGNVENLFPEVRSNFVAYSSGDAFARSVQAQLLQNQLTGITQGASSHIGSAAYFLGRSPANDSIYDQQFSGATNSNVGDNAQFPFYTSGQPLKAPIDIVLSWDQSRTGLDLDSHLTGPATDNPNSPVRFQTYWRQRGDLNTFPFALLYRDSIPDPNINPNGLIGVEQTRIGITQPGVYRFYVHNYSEFVNTPAGQVNGTSGLSNSGAQVQIFEAGTGIPTFDPNNPNAQSVGSAVSGAIPVPPNQQGNVWYVFQLDARTGILRRVNTFNTNIVEPSQVPAFGEPSR